MSSIAFLAKKAISVFVHPLGFSLLLLVVGMILHHSRRAARVGIALAVSGVLILIALSCPITSYLLLHGLESEAGPYADPAELHRKGVRHIVVLGGAVVTKKGSPSDRYGEAVQRVLEGVRLWKAIPGSVLVLSAGSVAKLKSDPDAMADLPRELGVPEDALILETSARDTEDEARLFARIVNNRPFALVTSAYHIPRSIRLFKSKGLNPIPCPSDFKMLIEPPVSRMFMLNARSLSYSEVVVHEYVGRLFYKIKHFLSCGAGLPACAMLGGPESPPSIGF